MPRIVKRAAARLTTVIVLTCGIAAPALAGSAYWYGNRSSNWDDGIFGNSSNWYNKSGMTPLNPPTDTAVIPMGARSGCCTFKDANGRYTAKRIVYQTAASQFFLSGRAATADHRRRHSQSRHDQPPRVFSVVEGAALVQGNEQS